MRKRGHVANDTPLRDAIAKVEALPEDELTIGVVHEHGGDTGAVIEAQRDIGQPGGWSFGASARWMRKAGYQAAAALKWKGTR